MKAAFARGSDTFGKSARRKGENHEHNRTRHPLKDIVTNEGQPRKAFYQDTLEELAPSIKERAA